MTWLTKAIQSSISEAQLSKLKIINSSFDETKDIVEKLWNQGEVDVFVGGSSNLQIIKESLNVPIVPIQISGFDILHNLMKAKAYGEKVVIVSFEKPIANLSLYQGILNLDVREKCYSTVSGLTKWLEKLIQGHETKVTVVGSSIVCDLCDEFGINSIFIYSSDGIKNAISQAIQIQESIQNEKYKSKQLDAILNYAYSGIMSIDENNIIRVFNPLAEKIMGIPKEKVLNKNVTHSIENTRLDKVLLTGKEEIDQIQRV
ncbi:MAG: PrpR N-terminal domain-containing protein [Tepidanaerobacteraceae bacterium]